LGDVAYLPCILTWEFHLGRAELCV
jgi:hypothetical protein